MNDDMWACFKKGGQKANIPALENAVNALITMTTQKTAGQRSGDDAKGRLPWEMLDVVKWTIICEATALVLSGELEKLKTDEADTIE